jgi:NitT/TauT family transport system permease protein
MATTVTHATAPAGDDEDDDAPRQTFAARNAKVLLGGFAVVLFLVAWEAVFLVVPFDPLFVTKPSLIVAALADMAAEGDLAHDIAVSGVPFLYGFVGASIVGVAAGIVMGWRTRVGYALDPLMTLLYASPLVALAPLFVVFFGVGDVSKTLIIFVLAVFPFIFNSYAGVHAVEPLLINVVRSLGGRERDLYVKVIVPSVLPYIVAGARIAVGRALIGILIAEFFAASEGIGYAIQRFGNLFAMDRMFAAIVIIMVIAVCLTEGIRWAERAAFPWRVGN